MKPGMIPQSELTPGQLLDLERLKALRNVEHDKLRREALGQPRASWELPFTNADLVRIVHASPTSLAELLAVEGIDGQRLERWGPLFFAELTGKPRPDEGADLTSVPAEEDDLAEVAEAFSRGRDASRVVSPPLAELGRLDPPLNRGEAACLRYLLRHLPPGWELYIQPHLNGLRPDFVLLHPRVGMAVFEVKDWNLEAMSCEADEATGSMRLWVEEDGEKVPCSFEDPIAKIHLYKEEIHKIYCPRSDARMGYALISAALVFPLANTARLHELFDPMRKELRMLDHERYWPLVGRDLLAQPDITQVLPSAHYSHSDYMTEDTADDLRELAGRAGVRCRAPASSATQRHAGEPRHLAHGDRFPRDQGAGRVGEVARACFTGRATRPRGQARPLRELQHHSQQLPARPRCPLEAGR